MPSNKPGMQQLTNVMISLLALKNPKAVYQNKNLRTVLQKYNLTRADVEEAAEAASYILEVRKVMCVNTVKGMCHG